MMFPAYLFFSLLSACLVLLPDTLLPL
jgi:hypothetical protein